MCRKVAIFSYCTSAKMGNLQLFLKQKNWNVDLMNCILDIPRPLVHLSSADYTMTTYLVITINTLCIITHGVFIKIFFVKSTVFRLNDGFSSFLCQNFRIFFFNLRQNSFISKNLRHNFNIFCVAKEFMILLCEEKVVIFSTGSAQWEK